MKKLVNLLITIIVVLFVFIPAAQAKSYEYSEKDKTLIGRVVYGESRNQPRLGKIAVALVVINRFESGKYGKTLRRVVFARHQFYVAGKTNASCLEAVRYAIQNRVLPSNTFYFRRSKSRKWRKGIVYYCRIGAHSFYTRGNAKPVKGEMFIDRDGKLKMKGILAAIKNSRARISGSFEKQG